MLGYPRQYIRGEGFSFVVVGGGLPSCLGGTFFDTESNHRNVALNFWQLCMHLEATRFSPSLRMDHPFD